MFSQRKQRELGASSAPYLDPERTLLSCHIVPMLLHKVKMWDAKQKLDYSTRHLFNINRFFSSFTENKLEEIFYSKIATIE